MKTLERIGRKLEALVDKLTEIADDELKRRKAFPYPVDLYGPRGTEIRWPSPPAVNPADHMVGIEWRG